MKTAFAYIQEHMPEEKGLITIDADGQHLVKDVIRVAEALQTHPDALVTGSRRFTGKVPFRSRAGNTITREHEDHLVDPPDAYHSGRSI